MSVFPGEVKCFIPPLRIDNHASVSQEAPESEPVAFPGIIISLLDSAAAVSGGSNGFITCSSCITSGLPMDHSALSRPSSCKRQMTQFQPCYCFYKFWPSDHLWSSLACLDGFFFLFLSIDCLIVPSTSRMCCCGIQKMHIVSAHIKSSHFQTAHMNHWSTTLLWRPTRLWIFCTIESSIDLCVIRVNSVSFNKVNAVVYYVLK